MADDNQRCCMEQPPPGHPIVINNPILPKTIYIPGNMTVGKVFYFSGISKVGGVRFQIDWMTHNGHIAFHFNPRFAAEHVCMNSCNPGWGPEEYVDSPFPFAPGVLFNVLVRCHHSHYEVVVNGEPFTTYKHRVAPVTEVNAITISGDVTIHSINIAS